MKPVFIEKNVLLLLPIFLIFCLSEAKAEQQKEILMDIPAPVTGVLSSYFDDFDRSNASNIGENWVDCHEDSPAHFEPLGIYDSGVVVSQPKTRPGEYDSTPPSAHPPPGGRMIPGIGCAWMDTGATTLSVKVIWSGNHGVTHPPPVSHVEATPLLYVTPDNPRYGFGAWMSELWGVPAIYAGYIGSPPEAFEVLAAGPIPGGHVSGTPREVELRAESPGQVTVWVDGKQVSFTAGYGLKPLEVDPTMINSTLHGFAVDAHFVDPVSNIPTLKAIESISINELR